MAALAVMARRPVEGRVKTRLAEHIGATAAAGLYRALLNDTISRAERLSNLALYLALEPDADGSPRHAEPAPQRDDILAFAAPGVRWDSLVQQGDGLGARLAAVFADLFASGRKMVAIIGSDSPALPTCFLERAFELLRANTVLGGADVVLGPAVDGGYYIIATTARVWRERGPEFTGLLAASPMGTPEVTRYTLEGLHNMGLKVATLPYWFDVDIRPDVALARGILPSLTAAPLPLVDQGDARTVTSAGLSAGGAPVGETLPGGAPGGTLGATLGGALAGGAPIGGVLTEPAQRGAPLERLKEVYLHITHRCATGCPQCYLRDARAEGPTRPWELDTSAWHGVIDQAAALGADGFVIIGGDPFLRPDLFDLVDHISGSHEASVRLFFNRSVEADTADRLAAVGRGRLMPLISIDGTRAVNDGLRGDGNFDTALSSIRALLGAGLRPVVNTVLLRPVLPALPALSEALAAVGVETIHLILPHQRGGLARESTMVPTGEELLRAFEALESTAAAVGLTIDNVAAWRRRLHTQRDLCSAGCTLLAVDPEGLVHACPITCGDAGFVAGDLRRISLEDIWRNSPVLELLRAAHARDRGSCRECPVVDACGGECWVQAHYAAAAAGERAGYLAPFPYCDFVRPTLERLGAGAQSRTGTGSREPSGATPGATEVDLTPFECI